MDQTASYEKAMDRIYEVRVFIVKKYKDEDFSPEWSVDCTKSNIYEGTVNRDSKGNIQDKKAVNKS